MKQENEVIEDKRARSTRQSVKKFQSNSIQKIKEANEICKMLGLKIKFSQIFVSQMVDESGRSQTFLADDFSKQCQMKEEMQIQVQNFDKGGIVSIWTEQQFDDKLAMMRDGLAALENQKNISKGLEKENKYNKEQFKTEIFDNEQDDKMFEDDFLSGLVGSIDTNFLNNQVKEKEVPKLDQKRSIVEFEEMKSPPVKQVQRENIVERPGVSHHPMTTVMSMSGTKQQQQQMSQSVLVPNHNSLEPTKVQPFQYGGTTYKKQDMTQISL